MSTYYNEGLRLFVLDAEHENFTVAASDGNASVLGNALANELTGNAGDNVLDGAGGADRLEGKAGSDAYFVDSADDEVVEAAGDAGTDTIYSSIDIDALAANVENLVLRAGAATAISGTGNGLNNQMTGNALDNVLDGGEGDDSLFGGEGDDELFGGKGNDLLDGGAGADSMAGGLGDDIYVIDQEAEAAHLVEAANEGADTVRSSVSHTLGENFENLVLTGTADLAGTGNDAANKITGNAGKNVLTGGAGNDILDGGTGIDKLDGGAGDDTFIVDNPGDVVVESAGTDTVITSVDYILSGGIETIQAVLGTSPIKLTGNALANKLTGNDGINVLDGGAGADSMAGGAGNDIYRVDNAADVVVEVAQGGQDTILTNVSYTIAATSLVEVLRAAQPSSMAALALTGSDNNNILVGAAGKDTLMGNGGKDRLDGGLGKDKLTGGTGPDTFLFTTKLGRGNVDKITDFRAKDDTIELDVSILKKMKVGKLSKDAFVVGTKALDSKDRIVYNDKKGKLFFDADGSGKGAAVHFATLTNKAKISAADFVFQDDFLI